MRAAGRLALVLLLGFPAHSRSADLSCTVTMMVTGVPGLREGSSAALSRRLPRRLFTINDSAAPEVVVLSLDGRPLGKVAIRGASVTDWEDVTTGTCPGGACLYVSDIGDNALLRTSIAIYRVLEPREGETMAVPVRFEAIYPDGPHDAEAVFTGPEGRLYLLTKSTRTTGLYAFPKQLDPDAPNRLERVAVIEGGTGRERFARITDAETSDDGRLVAVRSNEALFIVPTSELIAGRIDKAQVLPLRHLREPQGEGVALDPGGDVFLIGESSGRRESGTFARLRCMVGQ